MKAPGRPGVYPLDPRQVPEVVTRDSKLPPLGTTISQDTTIHHRTQNSISSKHTITYGRSRRVESSTDHPASPCFPDDDPSEITQTGYTDPGFESAYPSTSRAVSPLLTRPHPRIGVALGPGSGSFNSGQSPSFSVGVSPDSNGYPPPSNHRRTASPKRGVFQSLFPHSEQKKERKRAKAQDQIQTQSLAARLTDPVLFDIS
jgi:hypothetical protein